MWLFKKLLNKNEKRDVFSLMCSLWLQYACMPVRKMVTGTRVCHTDDDCSEHAATSVCVTPSLENQTRFIRVTHPPNTHMLFVGYPPHLQHAGMYSLSAFLPLLCCLLLTLKLYETFTLEEHLQHLQQT